MNNNTNIISKNCLPVSKGKTKTALLKNTQFNSLNNLKGEKYQDNRASFNDELFKVLTVPGMSSLKESSMKISTPNNTTSNRLNSNSSSTSLNNTATRLTSSTAKETETTSTAKNISTKLNTNSNSFSTSLNNTATRLTSSTVKETGTTSTAKKETTTLGIDKSPSISIPEALKTNKPDSSSLPTYVRQAGNNNPIATPINLSETNKQTTSVFFNKNIKLTVTAEHPISYDKNTANQIQSQSNSDLASKVSDKTNKQTEPTSNNTIPGHQISASKIITTSTSIPTGLKAGSNSSPSSYLNDASTAKAPVTSKTLFLKESTTVHQKTDKNITTKLLSLNDKETGTTPTTKVGATTLGIDKSPSISISEVLKTNKSDAINTRQDRIRNLSSTINSSRVKFDNLSSSTSINISDLNKQISTVFSNKNTASQIQPESRSDLANKVSDKPKEKTKPINSKAISGSVTSELSVQPRSEEIPVIRLKQTNSTVSSSSIFPPKADESILPTILQTKVEQVAQGRLNIRHSAPIERTDTGTDKKINTDNNLSKNIFIKEQVIPLSTPRQDVSYSKTYSNMFNTNDRNTDNLSVQKQSQKTVSNVSFNTAGSEPLSPNNDVINILQSKENASKTDITPKNTSFTGSSTTQTIFQSSFPFISNHIKTSLTTTKTGDLITTTFNLKPEHLGKLKISLISHNNFTQDKTSISELKLVVDNIATKQLLESNISQLKSALLSEGVMIQEFNISLNQDASDNAHQSLPGYNHSKLSTLSSIKDESNFDRNVIPSGINLAYEKGKIDLFI